VYPVMILYLQLNKIWFKKFFFNFTFLKLTAFTIIYSFSVFFYIIIKYYFLKKLYYFTILKQLSHQWIYLFTKHN
jgi:hypothetical protein